jgi:N-acetylglucosamine kinase-like BadF-type ATPase
MRAVLGVDAGGTATRCCIADESGHMLSVGNGGPANTNFVSLENAGSAIEAALSEALWASNVTVAAAILTGAHLPPFVRFVLASRSGTENVIIIDEFEACLTAGIFGSADWNRAAPGPQACGVVIMAGTGSFCKGRNAQGEERYAGGWGPLIGDEGSGYDIAREALRAMVKADDNRGPETVIREHIFSHLKIGDMQELKKRLYDPPMSRHELASLAGCVFAAAAEGDAVASLILRDAGARLASLSSPVLQELYDEDDEFPVVLAGGIPRVGSLLSQALIAEIKHICPRARVFVSGLQPVAGALIIGLQSIGIEMNSNIIDNLKKSVPR